MKNLKNLKSNHFEQNLNFGGRAEIKAVELLKSKYPTIRRVADKYDESFSDYDLIDNDGITVEVKADTTSKGTGNIAVEFESYGKPSGIVKTKAMFWFQIYYIGGWVYTLCEVEGLRRFLRIKNYSEVVGGEDNMSKMYLVPAIDFAEEFGCEKIVKN